jgi:hypothetical protein
MWLTAVASVIALSSLLVLLTAGTLAHAAPARGVQRTLTAAEARALSVKVDDKVIVVLRDQFAAKRATPSNETARADAARKTQVPVLNELALTGARHVRRLDLVNAIVATVSAGEAKRLADNPAIAEIVADEPIRMADPSPPPRPLVSSRQRFGPLPGACDPAGAAQLNPQAVVDIHAASQAGTGDTAQALGYTGKGVKVAFIADGLDVDNPDFVRPNGQHVFVGYEDFSDQGGGAPTNGGEAFLDASSTAAQGLRTYNVDSYGPETYEDKCMIRILGVAPGASLVGLEVLDGAASPTNRAFSKRSTTRSAPLTSTSSTSRSGTTRSPTTGASTS